MTLLLLYSHGSDGPVLPLFLRGNGFFGSLARDDFYFLEKNRILFFRKEQNFEGSIGELFYDSFQLVIEEKTND